MDMKFEKNITPSAESIKIANRLKELRSKKELSFEQLKKVLFEEYNIKISVDSLKNYEITEDHIRANSNLGMRIEYLNCFADFYGVTADYLLGRTDDPSSKPSIADELGLSSNTVENIKELCQDAEHFQNRLEALNVILSSSELENLLDNISKFLFTTHTHCDMRVKKTKIVHQYFPDKLEIRDPTAVATYLPPDVQSIYYQYIDKLDETSQSCKFHLFSSHETLSTILRDYSTSLLVQAGKYK